MTAQIILSIGSFLFLMVAIPCVFNPCSIISGDKISVRLLNLVTLFELTKESAVESYIKKIQ